MQTLPDAYPAAEKKVIMSSSTNKEDEECSAMMIYGGGQRLAFCRRPFGDSPKWTRIGGSVKSYQDFVYSTSQKLFFCVTKNGEMEAWDHSPKLQWRAHLPKEEEEEEEEYSGVRKLNYLVFDEQFAQLLLVKRHVDFDPEYGRYPHKTIAFDVDRVDFDKDNTGGASVMRLSRPRTTSGLSIFLGINHSLAISVPQLKPNSIYFTDPFPYMCRTKVYGGHDIGVFDYENRTFSPCYYPCDVSSLKKITPPPFWFMTPTDSSSTHDQFFFEYLFLEILGYVVTS